MAPQLLQRPLHAADLDPHELEDGVHVDGAVRRGVDVHLVVGFAGPGVVRGHLPHAVGHALAQNLKPRNETEQPIRTRTAARAYGALRTSS